MEQVMEQFASIVQYVAPVAITFGLCQWVIRFIISAMIGDYRGKWTY